MNLSDIYLPAFNDFHKAFKDPRYTFYILKGGRNSAKSSHISIEIILDRIKEGTSFVVAKRYNNSLSKTVIPQIKWAINYLGIEKAFKENIQAQSITYLPRGNKIYFIGADDPERIKGLKDEKYPISGLWIDELSQFQVEEDVDTLKNSIIRAELENSRYKMIYSYNPPKRKHNWVNKRFESVTIPDSYFIHHSTYLDNPKVAKIFIEEAENIKAINPRKYDHEYKGLPIGSGVVPFDNLTFRQITEFEIRNFDNIKQGIDWGYGIDPVHFARMHFDKTRRKLYIFGEIHQVKMGNRELSEKIKQYRWNDFSIIADSAEPKSISEMKEQEIYRISGANKYPGSVEHGEKWLDELSEIIIDPIRCPNTAREFENIDYAVDKDGNPRDRLVDKDNHSIDCCRYALSEEMAFVNRGVGINFKKTRSG